MIIDFNKREVEKITNSLKNDPIIRESFNIKERQEDDKGTSENRTEIMFYNNLSSEIAKNIELIKNYTIDEINNPIFVDDVYDKKELTDLKASIRDIMELHEAEKFLDDNLYKRIIYNIKYFSIREFFTNNYNRFIPAYDLMNIENSKKNKLLVEAFMKEFDRFASIIEDISYITDIDAVPSEYINYLSELVGNQKDVDDNLFSFITFREFIKNIIEIYKIKGTPYSIELFLGFIGFKVDVKEFWFDRRIYYLEKNRDLTNKNTFLFYLTEEDPRSSFINSIEVLDNDIVDTKNLYTFNKELEKGTPLEDLLGLNGSRKDPYTYFKTNIVDLDITPYSEDTAIDPIKQEVILDYIKFLTPVFIQTYTNYNVLETKLSTILTETIYLYDLDIVKRSKWSSGTYYQEGSLVELDKVVYKSLTEHISKAVNKPNEGEDWRNDWIVAGRSIKEGENPDYMLHIYSGYQPSKYLWDDGQSSSLNSSFKKGQGGVYPSGFYNGITEKLNNYDFNKTYLENLEELDLLNADVIKPLEEEKEEFKSNLFYTKKETDNIFYLNNIFITMNKNMSYIRGDELRNSNAPPDKSYVNNILSININTNEVEVVIISDYNPLSFHKGVKVSLFTPTLPNRGVYTIKNVRTNNGSFFLEMEEELKEDQLEGGNVFVHIEDWKYNQPKLKSLEFDAIYWEEGSNA